MSGSSSGVRAGLFHRPLSPSRSQVPPGQSRRAHEQRRGAGDRAGIERLRLISRAAHQHVGGHPRLDERPERAARHDHQPSLARRGERLRVARGHVRDVGALEQVPRERIRTARLQSFAERHDRPLVAVVDQRHGPPGLVVADRRMDRQPERRQPALAQLAQVVVAHRREHVARARQLRELHGGDGATSGGLVPRLGRVHDLSRPGDAVDETERDPLQVPHHPDAHPHILSGEQRRVPVSSLDASGRPTHRVQPRRGMRVQAGSRRPRHGHGHARARWRCPMTCSCRPRPATTPRRGASGTGAR